MSKLYATIPTSARRTVPTARGHEIVETVVRNWGHSVSTSIRNCGGGDADRLVITITDLRTGKSKDIVDSLLGQI